MRQLLGDLIAVDVRLDFGLMVRVVTQRIKDLGKGEMREVDRNFLRRDPKAPQLHNSAYGGPCARYDRFSAEDVVVPHDVTVFRCERHSSLSRTLDSHALLAQLLTSLNYKPFPPFRNRNLSN